MKEQCPGCGSSETVLGEVRNDQGLNGSGYPAFYLNSTKGKLFLFSEPCLYFDTNAMVCLGCGLLWSHVKPGEARKFYRKHENQ